MEKINPQKFRLKIRYIIALSTIAILMTSGQILIHNSLVKLSSDSRIVNIAGRQRMLSQKLSKIALGIESAIPGSEREELLGDLEQSLSLWQESHFGLQYQGGKLKIPSDNSEKVRVLFSIIEPNFLAIQDASNSILELGKSRIKKHTSPDFSDFVETIMSNEKQFLTGMNDIVMQYDLEAKAKVNRLMLTEHILMALILSLLIFQGLFVFRPAQTRIKKTFDKLFEAKTLLKRHTEDLERIVEERTKEIQMSEEKYRNLVENSIDSIYILQKDKYVFVNSVWEKLFGYSNEEALSDKINYMDIVAPESKEYVIERCKVRDENEIFVSNYEFKAITKSGELFDIEINTTPIKYSGRPAIHGIIRDITAEKREKAERLELQIKLHQAQKMESLGMLAGGVAHDLNNIIGPIMAYPDLIKMNLSDGKPVGKELDTIASSAQRAAHVISDLLALTRRGKYKMEPIDLNDLITEYQVSAEYSSTGTLYAKVKPNFQLSEDRLLFKGSEAHIPKVIMNLVNNAFESMPEGGVLSVKTYPIIVEDGELSDKNIPQGRYNLLTIEDQGEGIAKQNLSKIFDPFFTTKMKSGNNGTGLGLSVVYNVLKDHGAHIDVESEVGIGTKFSIYFPRIDETKQTTSELSLDSKSSGNIFVVDDRKEQREIASLLLSNLGYKVESAGSGQEAIKYLNNNDTDLVWLDMILEDDMDGLDTYKEIIKIKPGQKTIIVSGYSETDRVKEAEKLGVNGFMQKPYKLDDIKKIIQTVLNGDKLGSVKSLA